MAEITDEELAALTEGVSFVTTPGGAWAKLQLALKELQARRAAEAKAVEVDLPDYLRFGEPDMFPPAQK